MIPAVLVGVACFAGMGFGVAALIRSAEGASAVVNLIVLPMAFLSGSFGPTRKLPRGAAVARRPPAADVPDPPAEGRVPAGRLVLRASEGDRDPGGLGPRRPRRSRGADSAGSRASSERAARSARPRSSRPSSGAERVLDAGCGSGRLTVALAQAGAARDRRGHERGAAGGGGASGPPRPASSWTLREADFNDALPFAEASFDAVVSRLSVMAAADPVATLRELARVLAPGGRLVTVLWASPAENPWFAAPREAIGVVLGRGAGSVRAGVREAGRSGGGGCGAPRGRARRRRGAYCCTAAAAAPDAAAYWAELRRRTATSAGSRRC